MVTTRISCVLLAVTLAFAAGCSGSDDDGSDQANQSVGTGTRVGAGQAPAAESAPADDADPEDPCIGEQAAHNPVCTSDDGTAPSPAPAPN